MCYFFTFYFRVTIYFESNFVWDTRSLTTKLKTANEQQYKGQQFIDLFNEIHYGCHLQIHCHLFQFIPYIRSNVPRAVTLTVWLYSLLTTKRYTQQTIQSIYKNDSLYIRESVTHTMIVNEHTICVCVWECVFLFASRISWL